MTIKVHQHPIQTILAALQCLLIVSGSLFIAWIMKARGYPDPSLVWHPIPTFIRSYGFLLLLIPAGWVFSTLWLESHPRHRQSRILSLLTGFVLLGALLFLFFVSALQATGSGKLPF